MGFMRKKLEHFGRSLFDIDGNDRIKVTLLALSYAFIIGAYTIASELKNSIFVYTVGRDYLPAARIYSFFVLIPLILFYSRLVDVMRRYKLVSFYSMAYGLIGLLFTYLLHHPTIGLSNSHTSPYRLLGWFFYFYVEGFSPFIVSVFWAFANSISSPQSAKKHYALLVAGSKIGGMAATMIAWTLLNSFDDNGKTIFSDTVNHQLLLGLCSVMLLLVPFFINLLMKWVPGRYLHGYEAAYQFEKARAHEGHAPKSFLVAFKDWFYGMFEGLTLFIKQPYVLGIFGLVFFYDVVYTIISYLRIAVAQQETSSISQISASFFKQSFIIHFIGFIVSLFGTRMLLNRLGERLCLLLIPLIIGGLLLYMLMWYSAFSVPFVFIALKAIHYAFSKPIIESLYIPTVKELKFKSKSWIDAFGSKLAKGTGSTFNLLTEGMASRAFITFHIGLFAAIIGCWATVSLWMGYRFDKAVSNNEVIGSNEQTAV
jgi:AAA family ATP:ADP antiporter